MRYVIFVLVAGLILSLNYAYIGLRMLNPLHLQFPWSKIVWALLFIGPTFHIISFSLHLAGANGRGNIIIQWSNFLLLGFFCLVLTLVFARDAIWLTLRGIDALAAFLSSSSLRLLPTEISALTRVWNFSSAALLVFAFVGLLVGFFQARTTPRIENIDVPIQNLHPDLEGFRILQLTDIHAGPTIQRDFIKRMVDVANDQKPDLVAITGDIVDGAVHDLKTHIEPLGALNATHGVFFVTGNHEYYSGVDHWVEEVRRLGIRPLMNEHQLIEHKKSRLLVAGVTDLNGDHFRANNQSSPKRAIEGAPPHDARILLAHQPRSMFQAKKVGFDLQLSGHTHGGQFIPWNFLIPLQQPITAGLKNIGDATKAMWVYVSRGSGYWGPPLRLGIPAEISVLRLVRG